MAEKAKSVTKKTTKKVKPKETKAVKSEKTGQPMVKNTKSDLVKNISIKFRFEWLIILILVLVLFISILTRGFRGGSSTSVKALDQETFKTKIKEYIDTELLGGEYTCEVKDVKDDDTDKNMYTFTVTVEEQDYTMYATKDGKYLFTSRDEVKLTEETVTEYPKQDKPQLLLFTMSYCPYGNTAEDAVKPVYDLLKNSIDFQPHYVIYSNYATNAGGTWSDYCTDESQTYCSMHGIQELHEDVRELCVAKYQNDKFWSFVLAMNSNCTYQNADTCWEQVAKNNGVDVDSVNSCVSNETNTLLASELALNEQYSVSGSPDIILNGISYTGSRSATTIKDTVCSTFNSSPSECAQEVTESTDSSTTSGSCN